MSFEVNAREVLKHLNEMGYTDITATQLKEFIKDLKILIKYDYKRKSRTQKENLFPELYGNSNNNYKESAEFTSIPQEFYSAIRKSKSSKTNDHSHALPDENYFQVKDSTVPLLQTNYSNNHLYPTSLNKDYDEYEDSPKPPYYCNIFACSNSSNFDDDLQQVDSNVYDLYHNVSDVDYDDLMLNTEREEYLSKVFNNLYSKSTASSRAKSRNLKTHPVKVNEKDILGRDEFGLKQKKSSNVSSRTQSQQNISGTSIATENLVQGMIYNQESSKKIGSIRSEPLNNKQKQLYVSNTLSQFQSNKDQVQGIVGSENIRFEPKYKKDTETDESVKSEPIHLGKKSGSQSRSRPKSSDSDIRPRFSFIRPRPIVRSTKSDPVTLYHQYQEEWKKIKLPGEDKRFNLRWAVREKMLAAPDVDVRSRCPTVAKRSVNSFN